jgi:DNA-binding NarL/FixJ family response regulator
MHERGNESGKMSQTGHPSTKCGGGVVIIDDHPMIRERLSELINKEPGLFVCGQADNIREGVAAIKNSKARAVIVDISLKGSSGLELLKEIAAAGINIPVLVLSMHDESLYAERALRAGAKGYITKHADSATIIEAIHQVMCGEIYLAKHVASKILGKLAAGTLRKQGMDRLTDRELEVFELIGRGLTTREIGLRLGLSSTTVETYRARIKDKLGLENASQLSSEATKWSVHSTHISAAPAGSDPA